MIVLLLLIYTSSCYSQNKYDIKPFKGYLISSTFNKKGQWPISLNFMCTSLECIYNYKGLTTNEFINNIIDSTYIVPVELIPNLSLFKYFTRENNTDILPDIREYTYIYETLFLRYREKNNILLKDSSKFDFEYIKYYGFIFCPTKDSEIYKTKIVCGSIDYTEYPNIKLGIPIISGFIDYDKYRWQQH